MHWMWNCCGLAQLCSPEQHWKFVYEMLCAKANSRGLFYGCGGVLRTPTSQICRAGGLEPCDSVCQRHFDQIRREDNKKCSCPSTWGHTAKLNGHPIPCGYFQILDEVGRSLPEYKPGTRWCNKCRTEAPKRLRNWPRPEELFRKQRKVNPD